MEDLALDKPPLVLNLAVDSSGTTWHHQQLTLSAFGAVCMAGAGGGGAGRGGTDWLRPSTREGVAAALAWNKASRMG